MTKTNKSKLKNAIKEQKELLRDGGSFDDKYKIIKAKNGAIRDIQFMFGQWVGHTISSIMQDPQGQNYIFNYVLNTENNFPKDFKTMVFDIAKRLEAEDGYISMREEDDDIP